MQNSTQNSTTANRWKIRFNDSANPIRILIAIRPTSLLLGLLILLTLPASSILQPIHVSDQDRFELTELMNPSDIKVFMDGLMHAYLESNQIAGATVAVVHAGELLYSGGYGWADVESRIPVDPATSLFRIGSVTKLFTWTAIMQLRDNGLIDLDTDINEYLDFQIPQTFDEPITLRHLLTHTPGFEDRMFGLFSRVEGTEYREWLQAHLPARVRPPGTYVAYSNYGTTLAGYIVEQVSGMSWVDYIEVNMLKPLEMNYATPRQPLPESIQAYKTGGYSYENGRFVRQPFEWIGAHGAAGGMSASANSMSNFMRALLNGGELNGRRILEADTVEEMFDRSFESAPQINAMALGFYEQSSHGLRILGHGGGTTWFFTDLALIPELDLGIFVSFNSPGGALLSIGQFRRAVLDYIAPINDKWSHANREPKEGWEDRVNAYEGSYLGMKRSYTTMDKPFAMVLGRISIQSGDEGEIIMRSMFGLDRFLELEPGYFRHVDGHREIAFRGNPEKGYSHLFLSDIPADTFERLGFWQSAGLHLGLLIFCLLVFLSIPIVMFVRYLLQRRFQEIPPMRGLERGLRWIGLTYALIMLAFPILLAIGMGGQAQYLSGEGIGTLRLALALPILGLPLAILIAAGAIHAVRYRLWSFRSRSWLILVALAAVLYPIGLYYWNLLGWNF